MKLTKLKTKFSDKLLKEHELPAFECVHFADRPIIINCEHASNRIPEKLENLGLAEEFLQTHIAWDIGAGELCKRIALNLDATAMYCNYSRLVVDCNRNLKDPTAFIEVSDHIIVPGNQSLSAADQLARADAIFDPYHKKLKFELDRHTIADNTPVLIAIHSFTPALNQQEQRPWHVGILWDKDPRLPEQLLEALNLEPNLIVGDNQPYSGKHFADYTIDHHAEENGYAHVCIEIRQDLLENEKGIQEWSERLSRILGQILDDKSLYKKYPNQD